MIVRMPLQLLFSVNGVYHYYLGKHFAFQYVILGCYRTARFLYELLLIITFMKSNKVKATLHVS